MQPGMRQQQNTPARPDTDTAQTVAHAPRTMQQLPRDADHDKMENGGVARDSTRAR
jgi:hypothetical protein